MRKRVVREIPSGNIWIYIYKYLFHSMVCSSSQVYLFPFELKYVRRHRDEYGCFAGQAFHQTGSCILGAPKLLKPKNPTAVAPSGERKRQLGQKAKPELVSSISTPKAFFAQNTPIITKL